MSSDGPDFQTVRQGEGGEFTQALGKSFVGGGVGYLRAALENRGAPVPTQVKPALGLQQTISLGDGVMVDGRVNGNLAHGRETISRLEGAVDEQGAQAIGDLPKDGRGTGDVDFQQL